MKDMASKRDLNPKIDEQCVKVRKMDPCDNANNALGQSEIPSLSLSDVVASSPFQNSRNWRGMCYL